MDRREFLIGCGVAAVSIPLTMALNGCGGGGGGTTTTTTAAGFTVTSSVSNAHTHNVTILFADLTAQPAAGVSYLTDGGTGTPHVHTLAISQAQLNDINAGKTDSISTQVDGTGHTHQFTLVKPA
jgi:hypothetical protein